MGSAHEDEEKPRPQLRHLEFVRLAAAQAVVCLAGLYVVAKCHAGPLRRGFDAVESAAAPVYDRFHGLPLAALAFVDRKVDDMVQQLDRHVPPTLKAASAQACVAARGVPEVARELVAEVQKSGVTGAVHAAYVKIEPLAKGLYVQYGPVAGHLAVSTWRSLNKLPLFPQVAQIVLPTAAYWAEKYNKVISSAESQGYTGAQFLPPIPIKLIAQFFGKGGAEAETQ